MSAGTMKPIPIDEARTLILDRLQQVVAVERVAISMAIGRIAAEDIVSNIDLPATHNAAVDGYAVHSSCLADTPETAFRVAGVARAGHPFSGEIRKGEAVEIYTGGVMPPGPDCVAMHEDCVRTGDHVVIAAKLKAGSNMRPPGENLQHGEIVVSAGQKITAALIGQLAASGHAEINVYRQLKVVVLSTGDEIVAAGKDLAAGQISDANRPMLISMLQQSHIDVIDGGIVPDSQEALSTAYRQALDAADVVISSGGASDGIEDHTQPAMKAVGATCRFWRLAMKPGRPMAVGQRDEKLIFCLPGNPVAAFVCTRLLIQPALTRLGGGAVMPFLKLSLRAGFSHRKKGGRAEYLRVVVTGDGESQVMQLHGRKGAGVISSLTGADGLVEIPLENEGVEIGMTLSFLPFHERGL
ncbi:MAG: gephyrin-like molybdotransferase Glp [Candidatus Puniceispirillum sp.]